MPLILNGTTGVSGIDGSAGTPSYVGGDSDTGLWYPAANTLALSTSGSERLRVDSSGNVGIGTSSPGSRLTVSGGNLALNSTSDGNNGILRIQNSTGVTTIQSYADANDGWFGTVEAKNLRFITTNTERMRITSGGDLLVGTTTSPVQHTTTAGSIVATGSINSFSGNVGNTTNGTSYTLFTAIQGASYIVCINGANTCSVFLVTCESSSSTVTCTSLLVQNGANVTNSGTTIRFTNNYGGNLNNIGWSAIRLI